MIPARDELIAQLRTMYAQALEFPVEVVTADVDLEAELGLDSLQNTMVLALATDRWRLPSSLGAQEPPTPLTVEAVADRILRSS
ncbi:acyl carrier protein [Actinomadura gamaensis]|uniref:Acyl carrier protein n=1 Tax=Actinomadura gamaensis TaxID=1763541 RepID=A0ABV9UD28_9ACTN